MLVFILLILAASSHQAVVTWKNADGGRWDEPSNWDTQNVPTPDDSVLINFDPSAAPFVIDIINATVSSIQAIPIGTRDGSALPTLQGYGTLSVSNLFCDNINFHFLQVNAFNLFNSEAPCWLVQSSLILENETVLTNMISMDNSSSIINQGSFTCQNCVINSDEATGSLFINNNLLSIHYNSLFSANITNYANVSLIHQNAGDLTIGALHNLGGTVTSSGCFYLHAHNHIIQDSGSMILGGLWINSLLPGFQIVLNGGSLVLDNDVLGCPTILDGDVVVNAGSLVLNSIHEPVMPFYIGNLTQQQPGSTQIHTAWNTLLERDFLISVSGQCALHGTVDIQLDGIDNPVPSSGDAGKIMECGFNSMTSWFDTVNLPPIQNLGIFRVDTSQTEFWITPHYEIELKLTAQRSYEDVGFGSFQYNWTCFYNDTTIPALGVQVHFYVDVTKGDQHDVSLFVGQSTTDDEGISTWVLYSYHLQDDVNFIVYGEMSPCNNVNKQYAFSEFWLSPQAVQKICEGPCESTRAAFRQTY